MKGRLRGRNQGRANVSHCPWDKLKAHTSFRQVLTFLYGGLAEFHVFHLRSPKHLGAKNLNWALEIMASSECLKCNEDCIRAERAQWLREAITAEIAGVLSHRAPI